MVEDPDETFEVAPGRCARSLDGVAETARVRRQVVDVEPPPPPKVTEYQLVSRRCGGGGHVNDPNLTDVPRPVDPGSDVADPAADAPHEAGAPEPAATELATESVTEPGPAPTGTPVAPDPVVAWALRPGSPVRIGPQTTALAALLTCGHYLPIGRAASAVEALAGIGVSTGFLAAGSPGAPGGSLPAARVRPAGRCLRDPLPRPPQPTRTEPGAGARRAG